ncbi:MAG: Gfo/Idh/MocA family oxidoreductase [Desulfobacterales bacterium]|nr:Gfo/Idh/MocA family oxidoreductase [Desulfobacterales bacterium]
MERINIGVIGCGRISDLHFRSIAQTPGLSLYSVCDSDPVLAGECKKRWGAQNSHADYREMLEDPELDGVEILTPQNFHETMALDAAWAGKHIALQKPMTVDLKSGDRILSAVERADICFRVTDNYLFYPPIQLAKKLIDNGEIGTPSGLRIKLITGGSGGWEVPAHAWQWRLAEKEAGRGLQTFDHGHHLWTAAWYLLGDVERVSAWIDSLDGIIDSPAVMKWKYREQLAYGSCDFVHCPEMDIPSDYYANDEWIEITGSKGIIVIPRCTGLIRKGPGLKMYRKGGWTEFPELETDWGLGFLGAAENFRDAVLGKSDPMLSGEQARRIMRMALALARSSAQGREVYVRELDSRWGRFYSKWQRMKERGFAFTLPLGGGLKKEAAYAGQANGLTLEMLARFDADAVGDWSSSIAICLTPQGDAAGHCYLLQIDNGTASLKEVEETEGADLTLTVPAGTWAAILMGKKRIETALIQGRLKLSGRAELGLKLRAAFGI